MKKLYVAHIIALLLLLFLGIYFLQVYRTLQIIDMSQPVGTLEDVNYGLLGKQYGICSLFFFAFSIIVGIRTMPRLHKTGVTLTLGGIVFFAWSCLMISSPEHINIDEVFPAWTIFIIVAIGLSIYGFLKIDSIELININFEDQILDDYEL